MINLEDLTISSFEEKSLLHSVLKFSTQILAILVVQQEKLILSEHNFQHQFVIHFDEVYIISKDIEVI